MNERRTFPVSRFLKLLLILSLISLCSISLSIADPGDIKWKYPISSHSSYSPAIGLDNVIYVPSDNYMLAINPNGSLRWSFEAGGTVNTPSVDSNGNIYFQSEDGVYALNPSGEILWLYNPDDSWPGSDCAGRVAIDNDSTIYVSRGGASLHAIDSNGQNKWVSSGLSIPAISKEGILYGHNPGGTTCILNKTDGSRTTCTSTVGYSWSPSIGLNGEIYIAGDTRLDALYSDLTNAWQYREPNNHGYPPGQAVNDSEGVVYVLSWDTYADQLLHAINPDGSQKWTLDLCTPSGSPAVGNDGIIYVANNCVEQGLTAIDNTGTSIWFTHRIYSQHFSSPVIGNDGTVFIIGREYENGEYHSHLYAIETSSTGPATSSWPMMGANAQHTYRVGSSLATATEYGWIKSYSKDPNYWVHGYSVIPTFDNGFLVAGDLPYNVPLEKGALLLKLDNSGQFQWTKRYGDVNTYHLYTVLETADQEYIAAGMHTHMGVGSNGLIVKTDSSGNKLWEREYPGINGIRDIKQTSDGGYIAGGYQAAAIPYNRSYVALKLDSNMNPVWRISIPVSGYHDAKYPVYETSDGSFILADGARIIKLKSDGSIDWQKRYDDDDVQGSINHIFSIYPTADGNFIVCGQWLSNYGGGTGYFVFKIDTAGDPLWSKVYDQPGGQWALSTIEANNADLIVGGENFFSNKIWVLRLDQNGNIRWQKEYGNGSDRQELRGIIAETGHNIFIVGSRQPDSNDPFSKQNLLIMNLNSSGTTGSDCDFITDTFISAEDISVTAYDTTVVPDRTLYASIDTDVPVSETTLNEVTLCGSVPEINPFITQTPLSGPPGTTFMQRGTGFTPDTTAALYTRNPDNSEQYIQDITIGSNGNFEIFYESSSDKEPGTYTWWVIDSTGLKSNELSYEITEKLNQVLYIPGIMATKLFEDYDLPWNPDDRERWPDLDDDEVNRISLDSQGYSVNQIYIKQGKDGLLDKYLVKNCLVDFLSYTEDDSENQWDFFPYDWRLAFDNSMWVNEGDGVFSYEPILELLSTRLEEMAQLDPDDKVDIVAHSMGGLLAKYYLAQKGGNFVDKLILVDSPQTGTPLSSASIMHGIHPLANLVLIEQKTMRMLSQNMPTAYYLSPSQEYFNTALAGSVPLFCAVGRPYKLILNDDIEWFLLHYGQDSADDYKLGAKGIKIFSLWESFNNDVSNEGIFTDDNSDMDRPLNGSPGRINLFQKAKELHDTIDNQLEIDDDKVFHIIGENLLTLTGVEYTHHFKYFDVKAEPIFSPIGDGTVVVESQDYQAINGYYIDLDLNNKGWNKNRKHASIMELEWVQHQIRNLINGDSDVVEKDENGDDYPGDPRKNERSTEKINWTQFQILSPVDAHVYDTQGNHTGPREDGVVEEGIPNSTYLRIGERKYVLLPLGYDDLVVEFHGTDTGSFSLEIKEFDHDQLIQTKLFVDIPVTTAFTGKIEFKQFEDITTIETDDDGDGFYEGAVMPDPDSDDDGVSDILDNCLTVPNPDQMDSDGDGIGDLCEPVPGDLNGDGIVDRNDISIINTHRNQSADVCPACDIDGDGMITVLDARQLMMMCTYPRCASN